MAEAKATTEALKTKRTTSKRLFTRTEKAVAAALESKALDDTIQRRFEEFSKQWTLVQGCHDQYIESLQGYSEEEISVEDDWLDELSGRFYKLELAVDSEIFNRKQAAREEIKAITKEVENKITAEKIEKEKDTIHAKTSSVQLERMKFEPFNGDIRKYPQFKTEFQTYIKPLCIASQLPFILRSHLTSEVKEEMENVEDNYGAIWERLDEKYGDRGQLIDSIMAEIKNLNESHDSRDENTLEMIRTVEKAHRDLVRIREGDQMNNATILSLIEQKLPEKILEEWVKKVSTSTSGHESRFSELMSLLGEWRKRIEYRLATIRAKPKYKAGHAYHTNGSKKRSDLAPDGSRGRNEKCWIHTDGGEHPIWRCRTYQNKPVDERIRLAEMNDACKLCLVVGHTVQECRRAFTCPEAGCNGRHNKLLHTTQFCGTTSQTKDSKDFDSSSTILQTQDL